MKKSSKKTSWTIITDIEMEPAMQFIGQIKELLTNTQVTMEIANTQPPEDRYFMQLFDKQMEINKREASEELKNIENRLQAIQETQNKRTRQSRGLIDGGGKALK